MVVDDVEVARALAAAGERVVVVVAPEALPVGELPLPGRMAVMVGQTDDPAVRLAAAAMDAELFA